MKYSSLLEDINQAFSGLKKPLLIPILPEKGVLEGEYLAIQQDFGEFSKNEMSDEQCSMMICDAWLISDEALCYFLPRLARSVLQNRGFEDFLYRRIEKINETLLNQKQKMILNRLIFTLKDIEKELEIEEKQELEESWKDWEESLLQSENINEKLLLAIARNNIDNVKKLISQGANIQERDKQGNSPLDIANYKGYIKIIDLLKQAGAKE
ncbi:ankyrin repeat domain-containing protein [Coleofasciculus sp. FACHB-SPT9]|uniref:ankyrin repeat domain-containing protein n=1 Tax=Cyanophyceae TaxID=3028117 RepID=UPI001685AEE4|nr:ankyrin repeat domain-containing protein [Coleofasciculus sp. FACHB-SPT9]MBD1890328.1 ankyrin repeat domain-containing protein [Coleofasciculus sp. FACHB-SPT9]